MSGKRSAGRDNDPPIVGLQIVVGITDGSKGNHTYPIAPPNDHAIGTYA